MSGIVGKNLGRGSGVVKATPVADESIDSDAYVDASIDNAHLADDAVDSDELAAGAVDLAHMSAESVDSDQYVDGSIDEAHIADNAVTLAKMAGGTDGNIISFDASGDPVAIATGSDGEVLTSAGAGAPPAFEAAAGGGAWTMLTDGTQVADDDASLTVSGLDATYDTYAIVIADMVPVTDSAVFYMRLGDSGGLDSGASDYTFHTQKIATSSGSYASNVNTGTTQMELSTGIGNQAGEGFGCVAYLHVPGDGTMKPNVSWRWAGYFGSGVLVGGAGVGNRDGVIAVTQVSIFFSSGNISTGRFSVYGIKHT